MMMMMMMMSLAPHGRVASPFHQNWWSATDAVYGYNTLQYFCFQFWSLLLHNYNKRLGYAKTCLTFSYNYQQMDF